MKNKMTGVTLCFMLPDVFSSISPPLPRPTFFLALAPRFTCSNAWHRDPRWAPATFFPALGTGNIFPAVGTSYMFSRFAIGYMFCRAWHRLHVFPLLPSVTCFPAQVTGCADYRRSDWFVYTYEERT